MPGKHQTSLLENLNVAVILILLRWSFIAIYNQWKVWKKCWRQRFRRSNTFSLNFRRGRENSSIDQKVPGSSSCRPSVSRALVHMWHKRFTDSNVSTKHNESVGRPTLTDERALTLVREVIDTDRRLTVRDSPEMCDLKRTVLQFISKVSVQTLEVYSVRRRKVLKIIETYKSGNISTLHRDVKNRGIVAPRMLDLVFLDWHNFFINEDIWLKVCNKIAIRMDKTAIVLIGFVIVSIPNYSCCVLTFRTALVYKLPYENK